MIKSLLKLAAFWLLYFFVSRFVFLITNYESIRFHFNEIWHANLLAWRMDLAASCYLISVPALLYIIRGLIPSFVFADKIIRIFNKTFIVICSFICLSDAGIYKVWGTKINAKALSYLAYPQEVLPALFASENLGLLLIIVALILLFFRLYNYFHTEKTNGSKNIFIHSWLSLLVTGMLVLGARGGLQKMPISRNHVFHSSHSILNYAALNSAWNLMELLTKPVNAENNPYQYLPQTAAKALMQEMHRTDIDTTIIISSIEKPNIVFVFLESWNPDIMECYGGDSGVAPMFGKLAQEGILFTDFYATGCRTEQGLLAALSAHPAQPVGSVIHTFGKFDKLPNITRTFNNNGYHTSYFSGGRLSFDNEEAYLVAAGVQKIMGEDDFEIKKRTVWGAYDDETFALHLRELKKLPQPFFSTLVTMTTHEWFDADVPKYFPAENDNVGNNFRNTMHYSDSCLYAYLQSAKRETWYNNTLFFIMADHSCRFPYQREHSSPERHHIPFLITGGALRNEYKGTTQNRISSHTDLPATVLAQCNIKDTAFFRSKNLFNPYSPAFAYYAYDNGFGWITPEQKIVFDHIQQKELLHTQLNSSQQKLLQYGKAYLQINFQEGMDYGEKKGKF